jgi:formylglycine-generating enzyme required for sulfatase activity
VSAARFAALLAAAWRRSDELFARIPQSDLLQRPIPLRHPFLFYLGHLPAFAWNQIGRGVLGEGALHERFDQLFERGIDPADEASAHAASIEAWPSVAEIVAHRDEVRRAVLARLDAVLARPEDVLCARGRILHLVIEHELMHHETLMYMLQEHASGEAPALEGGEGRAAERIPIPAGKAVIGADFADVEFGWDNEFGRVEIDVPAFALDSLPVRNGDWLAFMKQHGEGALMPQTFVRGARGLEIKTVLGRVPFELAAGWPVQVSGEQARAYASSRGGRLPTEAELRRATFGDRPPEMPSRGNLGFRRFSPVPVGSHEDASPFGVEELVGNGWEWTQTPFAPLPGFTAYARTYPGYSADFFDGAHDVVFGASWATDEKLVRPSFRNWYRRDYPYVFSSFRVAYETPSSR